MVMSLAAETFKSIAVLCVQGSMFAMMIRLMQPTLRNPRYRAVLSGVSARHFGAAILILLPTLVVGTLLIAGVPGMDIGWLKLIGGSGNAAVASSGTPGTAPLLSLVLPLLLVLAIALVMPMVVLREERQFRRGSHAQSPAHRWRRQLTFGLAHLVMGIPIGAALALSVAGGGFMHVYRRGFARRQSRLDALMASSRTHLAYNAIVLFLVFLAASILLMGRLAGQ